MDIVPNKLWFESICDFVLVKKLIPDTNVSSLVKTEPFTVYTSPTFVCFPCARKLLNQRENDKNIQLKRVWLNSVVEDGFCCITNNDNYESLFQFITHLHTKPKTTHNFILSFNQEKSHLFHQFPILLQQLSSISGRHS